MFAMGSFKVIFEMAYQTYIPEIVDRKTLVNANSKIMMSYALSQSAGPGLAGVMVEILGALFGGWLGSIIGIRQTLAVAATGLLVACLGAGYSQLKRLKSLPEGEIPEENRATKARLIPSEGKCDDCLGCF